MPKRFPPGILESPEARAFCLQKQITDLHSLKRHLRESVCLSIDVEGCEGIGQGITSIGLATLPPTDLLSKAFPSIPFKTQEAIQQYHIVSYCLHVEGRSRRKPHPPFPFGSSITTADPGGEINAIIDHITQHYPSKDIILIGWHPHPREFPAIQALIPGLFQKVTGWVDVVNITQQICISKQEDLTKSWPPLSDVMLCVGFSEDCLSQRFNHSAGSDAIHAVVVLVRLLTCNNHPDDLPIELQRRRPLKQWQQQQPDSGQYMD